MSSVPSKVELFVAHTLWDSSETLDWIMVMLNDRDTCVYRAHWPQDFEPDEVADALKSLVKRGFVRREDFEPDPRSG